MRVMVLVKASQKSEAGIMPSERLLTEMGKFNEELVKAGIMLAGEGLHPSSKGVRVRFSGNERLVVDGPFAETKELLAGYWLWQVKSMDEAIAWVKRCPNPMEEECEIEIRPVFEADDFGEAFTPELREQEDCLRAAIAKIEPVRQEAAQAMLIAGLNASYSKETRGQIPAQWGRFAAHLGKIADQVGKVHYGVCWSFREDCGFDYLCGVEVANGARLPAGFTQLPLPPRRYAVFAHRGHVSELPSTMRAIWDWQQRSPNLRQAIEGAPCFERYSEEFDPQSGMGGIEVWVPIQR